MEWQLSCDSVSSVTSTVSGASMSSYASLGSRSLSATHMTHCNSHNLSHTQSDSLNPPNQAKLKKRSWLRSSFRRAFGRHSRKRSKQIGEGSPGEGPHELPLHHTVNSAVRHLPPPPPSSHSMLTLQQQQQQQKLASIQKKQKHKQHGVCKESDLLTELKQEATERERALTDCRLELLSAQHQLQTQADAMSRLQAEVTGLKEENARLVSLVRGQYGPAADALLTPLTHTLSTLTLSNGSVTGGSITPREDGRHVKVMVVNQPELTSAQDAATVTLEPHHLTHIGNISVESKTTWQELDLMITNSLKDYGNRVDPVSALGLDAESILCYRVEDVVRATNLPRPELLPYGYCVGDVDALYLWLKGGNQKKDGESISSVSAASFSSLTPATSMKRLANLLVEHRRLVLAGPPAAGKTSLAHALAQFYVVNSGRELNDDAIKTFRVTGSNTLELCQMLSGMWPRDLTSSRSASTLSNTNSAASVAAKSLNTDATHLPPAVIILDDLHTAGGVVETLQRCLPVAVHTGPAIIATCCPTATLSTRLHIHCNFRWAALNTQQEPVRGLLGRVLRRRVVAAEVAANTRLPDAHHLAEWLTRLWLHLNTVLSGHCGSHEVGIGPGMLMDCPLGHEETQAWFTDVWNTRLVPCIISTVQLSTTSNSGLLDTWTDPLDWVLATYPWANNAACGTDQLTRIPASDVSQQDASLPVGKAVSPRRPYVPLSARQQNHTPESRYAVLQVPVVTEGMKGTGQATFTTPRDCITCSNNQDAPHHVSESKRDDWQSINSNITSESLSISTLQRTRRNTIATSSLIRASSGVNGTSGSRVVIIADQDNNNITAKLTTGRSNNNRNPTVIKAENKIHLGSLADMRVSAQGMSEDEAQLSSEDELMDQYGILSEQDEKAKKSITQNQNGCIGKVGGIKPVIHMAHSTKIDSNEEIAMETDYKPQLPIIRPQILDVLTKNAINAIGVAPECMKIIHGGGSKLDLKVMAQELTTTFKPVESTIK
nr:neuron navigator 2-like [Cherax quadricarinatus]